MTSFCSFFFAGLKMHFFCHRLKCEQDLLVFRKLFLALSKEMTIKGRREGRDGCRKEGRKKGSRKEKGKEEEKEEKREGRREEGKEGTQMNKRCQNT